MEWGPLGTVGQGHPEEYTDFVFSTGWLSAFRARGGIGRQKLRGDTNSQQVNTLAEEFLDYNEDEANVNISPEVVGIEDIIDDLKSVDNEEEGLEVLEDLYSPPPIPLIKTAQARSHLTELVQHLEALSVSELPGGAKPNLNVVVAIQ